MKNDQGKVLIPGFYNGIVLTDEIKSILNDTPHNEEELKNILQFSETGKLIDEQTISNIVRFKRKVSKAKRSEPLYPHGQEQK